MADAPKIPVDYTVAIEIGRRTRIATFHRARARLVTEIEKAGFSATDAKLFNMLTIEVQAMRLVDEVCSQVEFEINDLLAGPDGGLAPAITFDVAAEISDNLAGTLEDKLNAFVSDQTYGLAYLIEQASGTHDPGFGFDPGYGPQG